MQYIVIGKIAPYAGNRRIVGKETYLAELADHYFVWDGKHRAAHFERWSEALEAAMSANGPLWRMPIPESVIIVPVGDGAVD